MNITSQVVLKKENKKVAIVCFGTRITLFSKNVRCVDFIYLRDILQNIYGRTVDFVSLKLKTEEDLDYYKSVKDVDLNDYDEVVIYNAAMNNAFAGIFKSESIETFVQLANYKGDIWYYLCDPKMPCINFAACLKNRIVNNKIKIDKAPGYRELTPEFCDNWTKNVYPRINTMFAGCDYDKYYTMYTNKLNSGRTKVTSANTLNPNYNWCCVPLFEYYAVNEKLDAKLKNYPIDNRKYDLVYFGNNRMTERNKIIANMYDQPGLKNYIIGFDPQFSNCEYDSIAYINHDKLFEEIPSSSLATLILGDTLHNNNIRTPRFFEAMLLDVVAFIYTGYDENKKFVKNQELKDFIYVTTPEELKEKINKIKNYSEYAKHIIELERKDILDQFKSMKING